MLHIILAPHFAIRSYVLPYSIFDCRPTLWLVGWEISVKLLISRNIVVLTYCFRRNDRNCLTGKLFIMTAIYPSDYYIIIHSITRKIQKIDDCTDAISLSLFFQILPVIPNSKLWTSHREREPFKLSTVYFHPFSDYLA